MIKTANFSIYGFKQWLETLPSDKVFDTCNSKLCPLAEYLKFIQYPFTNVSSVALFSNNATEEKLPEWAMEFVTEVDEGNGFSPSTTVENCLKILNRIIQYGEIC